MKGRLSRERYQLQDGQVFDRADLLLIPGPDAEKYPQPGQAEQAASAANHTDPRLEPLPARERRVPARFQGGAEGEDEEDYEPQPRPARERMAPERFREEAPGPTVRQTPARNRRVPGRYRDD